MRWLCVFRPCRWLHVCTVLRGGVLNAAAFGIYQCSRCKTISTGAPR